MSNKSRPLRSVCIHEAGHAVVGLLQGLEVRRVSSDPTIAQSWHHTGESAESLRAVRGTTQVRIPEEMPADGTIAFAMRYVAYAMAGCEAEELIGHRRHRWGDADIKDVNEYLTLIFGEGSQAIVQGRALRKRVRRLIRRELPALRRIADALIKEGTLERPQLRRLFVGGIIPPKRDA